MNVNDYFIWKCIVSGSVFCLKEFFCGVEYKFLVDIISVEEYSDVDIVFIYCGIMRYK